MIENYKGSCKFLLQTKNPGRFFTFIERLRPIYEKIILGTTIETDGPKLGSAPSTRVRWNWMVRLKKMGFKTFLSHEPLADFDPAVLKNWIETIEPEAVEIGLENYTNYQTAPPEEKILSLIEWLKKKEIPFVLKENLKHLRARM